MSEEVLKIVRQFNRRDWELQIAFRCAPLITGVKISTLLTVPVHLSDELQKTFKGSQISLYALYHSPKTVTYLLFRRKWLEHTMGQSDTASMMRQFGYRDLSFRYILRELAERYKRFMEQLGAFPHEIGLLLGYPLEDVSGFILNKGKNFLYSGYWKVYSNPAGTMKLFEQYDRAAEQVIHRVSQGLSLTNLIKFYEENQEVSA